MTGGATPQRRLFAWALSAAAGGFAFGYQTGVISGALLFVRRDFHLGSLQQGAVVAALPLGAVAGGLLAGRLADRLGRRPTLLLDGVVFLAGTLVAVASPTWGVLLAARALVGAAVGAASATVPLYLSEIAPPAIRGRLVTVNQLMVTLGILAAYCVDFAFAGSGSWRAMFAVGLLPAGALLTGMLRAPETPAWLDAHGRPEVARQVIAQVADERTAERMLEDARRARAEEASGDATRTGLRTVAGPALVIGTALAAAQQLSGINAIVSYAPTIMAKTGLSLSDSVLYSVLIALVNVAATVVSFRLVDRFGRRPLLLVSLAGMLAALAGLGLVFALPHGAGQSWLAVLCLLVYIAAFAVGLGPVFWVLIAEIFPPRVRASGASAATATNWLSTVAVGLGFLPLASAVGQGATFWILAGVCAVAFVFVSRYVPETMDRSFAEIDADLRGRWRSPALG
jgi:sugar porter (SP) family MFS transporter